VPLVEEEHPWTGFRKVPCMSEFLNRVAEISMRMVISPFEFGYPLIVVGI
jgi:hypothetical protein